MQAVDVEDATDTGMSVHVGLSRSMLGVGLLPNPPKSFSPRAAGKLLEADLPKHETGALSSVICAHKKHLSVTPTSIDLNKGHRPSCFNNSRNLK